eukprot:752397-Hanusia_phi.AAC.2
MFMHEVRPQMSKSIADVQELTAEIHYMQREHAAKERQIAMLKEENEEKGKKLKSVMDLLTK